MNPVFRWKLTTLCVLKDKECVDLSVFREKEEMALTKNKITETNKQKTHPKLIKHHLWAFLPWPTPNPCPPSHQQQVWIKTETSAVAFTGVRRRSWCTLRNMCTDGLGRKSKAQILWYDLTYYHIWFLLLSIYLPQNCLSHRDSVFWMKDWTPTAIKPHFLLDFMISCTINKAPALWLT